MTVQDILRKNARERLEREVAKMRKWAWLYWVMWAGVFLLVFVPPIASGEKLEMASFVFIILGSWMWQMERKFLRLLLALTPPDPDGKSTSAHSNGVQGAS
jgi:hypothetical protein